MLRKILHDQFHLSSVGEIKRGQLKVVDASEVLVG
jgi:hypothetical protein